jgi:hypothetical protein
VKNRRVNPPYKNTLGPSKATPGHSGSAAPSKKLARAKNNGFPFLGEIHARPLHTGWPDDRQLPQDDDLCNGPINQSGNDKRGNLQAER